MANRICPCNDKYLFTMKCIRCWGVFVYMHQPSPYCHCKCEKTVKQNRAKVVFLYLHICAVAYIESKWFASKSMIKCYNMRLRCDSTAFSRFQVSICINCKKLSQQFIYRQRQFETVECLEYICCVLELVVHVHMWVRMIIVQWPLAYKS